MISELDRAQQLAGVICDELNVKELTIPVGESDKGDVKVHYKQGELDVEVNSEPQGRPDLAAKLFLSVARAGK